SWASAACCSSSSSSHAKASPECWLLSSARRVWSVVEPLLRVQRLHKHFGGVLATNRVDLSLAAGEIHALIGPNGARKTTLIHQLSGALKPDGGSILFLGRDVTRLSLHERVQLGMARSYQITSIFRGASVLHNLALAVLARNGSSLRFWQPLTRERSLF